MRDPNPLGGLRDPVVPSPTLVRHGLQLEAFPHRPVSGEVAVRDQSQSDQSLAMTGLKAPSDRTPGLTQMSFTPTSLRRTGQARLHASGSTGQRPMRLVRPRPFTAGEADPWAVLPDSIDASTAFARTDNHDLSRSRPDPYQRGQEMQGHRLNGCSSVQSSAVASRQW